MSFNVNPPFKNALSLPRCRSAQEDYRRFETCAQDALNRNTQPSCVGTKGSEVESNRATSGNVHVKDSSISIEIICEKSLCVAFRINQ